MGISKKKPRLTELSQNSPAASSGGPDQSADGSAQRAAHPADGPVHGVLLHAVLDALRRHGTGGHLWRVGAGDSRG